MRAVILAALGLALLACARGQDVDCTQPAPCLSPEGVNASISALTDNSASIDFLLPMCTDLSASLEALVADCAADLDQQVGCPCSSECTAAVTTNLTPDCLESLVAPVCTTRAVLESLTEINILNLVLHLVNDCAGVESKCPQEPAAFDASVCEAGPVA